MKPLERVDRLVVHHSASNPKTTTVETLYQWHVVERKWSDIGYHWVITADGKVHPARPLTRQGAHAPKVNSHSWGVCVVGDNTKTGWGWNQDQEEALLTLIEAVEFLVPGIIVLGHRDTGQATECPGLDVQAWLKGIL
jgi:N-acetylmuramoyl-L-alanine amidase